VAGSKLALGSGAWIDGGEETASGIMAFWICTTPVHLVLTPLDPGESRVKLRLQTEGENGQLPFGTDGAEIRAVRFFCAVRPGRCWGFGVISLGDLASFIGPFQGLMNIRSYRFISTKTMSAEVGAR
jgi:hypothetical protein